jgi:hypothetical protein
MTAVIQTIWKTTGEWEEENPALPEDMLGIEELESGKYKIKRGDGETAWDSLDYFTGAELSREECAGVVDDYTVDQRSAVPSPNKTAMYNGRAGLKSDNPPAEENDVVRLKELQNASGDIEALAEALDAEAEARGGADDALQEALDAEAEARGGADAALENGMGVVNAKISALNGAYFVLEPYNFGKSLDVSDDDDVLVLNTYAISQTPGASSVGGLNDNTVVINEFDNSEFIYNKRLDVWLFYPNGLLAIAANQSLGVVKGVSDPGDGSKDGAVTVNLHGEMKTLGVAELKGRMEAVEEAAAGKVDVQQNASDEGKALVIGSGGAVGAGFSGVVDSVDGVGPPDPETSKNVKLTYTYETEAGFEADKDDIPEGARVVKLYEFPDNASVLRSRPDLWPAGAEMDLGGGLYGVALSGVLPDWSAAGALNFSAGFTIGGWNNAAGWVVSSGGGYQKGSDASWHVLGYSRWAASASCNISVVVNPVGNVYINAHTEGVTYNAANANYRVWLTYRKG